MAIYRVWSGATGAANGSSWTDAYTAFASALTVATVAGDEIWIASDHNEQLASDATYTIPAAHTNSTPLKIFSVARADDTLAVGAFVGHDTLNRGITFTGSDTSYYVYGVTWQVAGSTTDSMNMVLGARQVGVLEQCKLWMLNTSGSATITVGNTTTQQPSRLVTVGCDYRWGSASQGFTLRGDFEDLGSNLSSGATHPTYLFETIGVNGGNVKMTGSDLSNFDFIVGTPVNTVFSRIDLYGCRLKSGVVFIDSTATAPIYEVYAYDCAAGDEHFRFAYATYRGTMVCDTAVYASDNIGDANFSWKITTTAEASWLTPFCTPWISLEHSGVSTVSPYIEAIRTGSTTRYNDNQLWAEVSAKETTGSTRVTIKSDRLAPRGTAAAQAASSKTAADWIGEDPTNNAFMLLGQVAVTPVETGHIRMRVCMGVASSTVYIDPQIRI